MHTSGYRKLIVLVFECADGTIESLIYIENGSMAFLYQFMTQVWRRYVISRPQQFNFIFYKIVSFNKKSNKYMLQCINTKAVFACGIIDLVNDMDIIWGLHPLQSSYIGLEYVAAMKNQIGKFDILKNQAKICDGHRYGKFRLLYERRDKAICFSDKQTNETHFMDSVDIVFSNYLISEFDAVQAFYIGVLAGLKINSQNKNKNFLNHRIRREQLFLIRNSQH